jgi:hypothetical protein
MPNLGMLCYKTLCYTLEIEEGKLKPDRLSGCF